MVGRVEVASLRQVKGLMRNCAPIYAKLKFNNKVILSPFFVTAAKHAVTTGSIVSTWGLQDSKGTCLRRLKI